MAKKLTKEQGKRASICFECGCIPSKDVWREAVAEKGKDYDSVMYMAKQFPISECEVITIEELQSIEEIHAVADNYNWDNNCIKSLYAFIDHPLCDAGTALLLFWKGAGYEQLGHHPRFPNEQEKLFFQELVLRFKTKQFNSYKIAFDPYDECYVPTLDDCLQRGYLIPGELFCQYSTMHIDTYL
ncbi:DUF4274 domain-containing protein [Shewanella woodyi]|uniref:DUF4274 domain-containing protein n=1 Tax=Shewanella woodyi (strain ATCC 51908 / MS32) TaxID=392500 RepID=B1KGR4_SHEWM|nr:DUF4274 domain-containing protein [Shewanella woodyi]ACA86783.1 conserved hypothetical protein [Shewanella woodyi ATCC 51908]